MSKAIRASVLVLLLACSARADWMPNGSPAPPQLMDVKETAADGEMQNGVAANLTQIALDLLAVLPSLY